MTERGEWPPVKTQTVRLLDVVLLGPAMIFAGATTMVATSRSPLLYFAGLVTAVGGFATIGYNAVNYGRVAQRLKAQQQAEKAMLQAQQSQVAGLGSGYWEADPQWGETNLAWQNYMRSGYYVQRGEML